jgi:protein kinase
LIITVFEFEGAMDDKFMIKDGCYVFLEEIGGGAHATVWKALNQVTGRVCAIKRMDEMFSKYEDCCNLAEVKCLQKLSPHENIVALHDVILEDSTLYLVLDLMECSLFDLVMRGGFRPCSEHKVRNFCFQILKGLVRMHTEGYCHRDLKLENLLVSGDILKIGDFGLASMLHESNEPLQSYVVTRSYRAPELLLGSTDYDFAIDIWAMGVIMAELFTGYLLFTPSNMINQVDNICSVIGSPDIRTWLQGSELAASMDYNFPEEFTKVDSIKQLCTLLPSASALAIDLINRLLSWNPKTRPTAMEALQHPFFYPCYNNPLPLFLPHHSLSDHSKALACDGQRKSNDNVGFFYNPYPVWQNAEYVSELNSKPFPGMVTFHTNPIGGVGVEQQMPSDYDSQEDRNSRPTA